MFNETVKLWENGTPGYDPSLGQPEPYLTPFLCDKADGVRGCVIVIPGGAYRLCAPHEGEPVARVINEAGIHAFVLNYRVAPYKHPAELSDALRAIRLVRHRAAEFGIAPDKIAVLGFSAGGHLAVSASEHFDYGRDDGDEIDRESSRPDGAIFCYPVASLFPPYTHLESRSNLLGEAPDEQLVTSLSGPEAVRDDMPPVFMWHTFEDKSVRVENSLMMASALRQKNIPTELHVFPDGRHGLGLAAAIPHTAQWSQLLKNWLIYNKF